MLPFLGSAAVGAVVGVAALLIGRRAEVPPAQPAAEARQPAPPQLAPKPAAPASADRPAALPSAASETAALPRPASRSDDDSPGAPLHIVADPPQLRVWSNTAVRLRVDVAPLAGPFERFVWHFEDGSDPVAGQEVEHTFGESVRDRHVTVQGLRGGRAVETASKTLPVERLPVAALDDDGGSQVAQRPKPEGTRILFAAGVGAGDDVASLAARAADEQCAAMIAGGNDVAMSALGDALHNAAPQIALLRWRIAASDAGPALAVYRDDAKIVRPVQAGERPTGVLAIGEVALVAFDSRPEVVAETDLSQLRAALAAASAYANTVLVSPRPLTPFCDSDLVADRAYRVYEYALRNQVSAVVSAASEVFYDGRFGSQMVVAVGRAELAGCQRLIGDDACQPASATVAELGQSRRVRVMHWTGPQFGHLATDSDLPPEAGKIRRRK